MGEERKEEKSTKKEWALPPCYPLSLPSSLSHTHSLSLAHLSHLFFLSQTGTAWFHVIERATLMARKASFR